MPHDPTMQRLEWLQVALDALDFGLYVKDGEGCYLYANRPYLESLGLEREQVEGASDRELETLLGHELESQLDAQLLPFQGDGDKSGMVGLTGTGASWTRAGSRSNFPIAPGGSEHQALSVERERIARYLHNSVAQTLSGMLLHMETLSQSLLESVDQVRALNRALTPPLLELGLRHALRVLYGERVDIRMEPEELELSLDPAQAMALYSVVQEQMLSGGVPPTRVQVELDKRAQVLVLEIAFDDEPPKAECLSSVQARAAAAGGRIELLYGGRESVVRATLPVKA
ncbi:MAG: histidine kinase [Myxococcales bacterium]|nr:histidine kinase [Myxococcales bacterium]